MQEGAQEIEKERERERERLMLVKFPSWSVVLFKHPLILLTYALCRIKHSRASRERRRGEKEKRREGERGKEGERKENKSTDRNAKYDCILTVTSVTDITTVCEGKYWSVFPFVMYFYSHLLVPLFFSPCFFGVLQYRFAIFPFSFSSHECQHSWHFFSCGSLSFSLWM